MHCPPSRPAGITAISLFFAFGATMSGLTAMMLAFPGTALDSLWRLNPRAPVELVAFGRWAIVWMALVCALCLMAAIGLWRCLRWGMKSAIFVLAVNLAGDLLNAAIGHDLRALIGIPVGGAMIAYLFARRRVFTL